VSVCSGERTIGTGRRVALIEIPQANPQLPERVPFESTLMIPWSLSSWVWPDS
jgi:hypothetical protein